MGRDPRACQASDHDLFLWKTTGGRRGLEVAVKVLGAVFSTSAATQRAEAAATAGGGSFPLGRVATGHRPRAADGLPSRPVSPALPETVMERPTAVREAS